MFALRCKFVFLVIGFCGLISLGESTGTDPDEYLDTVSIVKKNGYPIETHYATTKDGYILALHRIPHGRAALGSVNSRPPVLVQHALLCSSFDWVNMAPHQSLGFILADAGYDVWMGNNRGSTYSENHTTLDPTSREFWDFTYDEMALYDVPANIDKILGVTGFTSLSYIGHSQGTLQGFAGFSTDDAVAAKVNVFIALAPVAYVNHITSPVFTTLSTFHVTELLDLFGYGPFLSDDGSTWSGILNKVAALFCAPLDVLCNDVLFLFCGKSNHINVTRLPVFLAHTPAGTSNKNMNHWTQGVLKDVFQSYDYFWPWSNMEHYGHLTPPAYNLNNLKVPTALLTGSNDILADADDVAHMVKLVPNTTIVFQKQYDSYAHLDFAWGQDAFSVVYPDVLDLLTRYARPVRPFAIV